MSEEIWRPVPDYETRYEVSDLGRVRSLDRFITCVPPKRGYPRTVPGCILKPSINPVYESVQLCNGRKEKRYVAHLVLAAFVGPRPDGMHVCHSDGNPRNNRLDNLRYDTPGNNELDKLRHGTLLKGSSVGNSKLTEDEVAQIISLRFTERPTDIARRFGVSQALISSIFSGKLWKWRTKVSPESLPEKIRRLQLVADELRAEATLLLGAEHHDKRRFFRKKASRYEVRAEKIAAMMEWPHREKPRMPE